MEESEEIREVKNSETVDPPAARDSEGGRRRRRRGGRGRNRDRGPRPEGSSQEAPSQEVASENGHAIAPQASAPVQETSNGQPDNGGFPPAGNGQQQPGEGGRRRR